MNSNVSLQPKVLSIEMLYVNISETVTIDRHVIEQIYTLEHVFKGIKANNIIHE